MKTDIKTIFDRRKNDLRFVVKEIGIISAEKKYFKGIGKCNDILAEIDRLDNITGIEKLSELEDEIFLIIDEFRLIIDIEKRFVLFPLPDIKKEAFEMGKKYMDNFLEWTQHENETGNSAAFYTSEEILKILEDESFRLDEMKDVLKILSH